MDDNDALRKARDHYIQKFRKQIEPAAPIAQKILSLDQDIGELTDLSAIVAECIALAPAGGVFQIGGASGKPKLRPDEFMNKTVSEAARLYLEKIGHAVSMDELLDALKRGGRPAGGATPKKSLYISLVRSREFVPIPGQTGVLGLRKFYEKK